MKKTYTRPEMEEIEMKFNTQLLSSSSVGEPDDGCENDNPWWNGCHEGWKGGWGD